ncbi:LysE family translocator [Thermodesulfobacteriota bacterium]
MIYALTAGMVLGLSAGLAPGPLLTLVITQTLKHNIKEGLKVAIAPLITDLPIILVSLFVLTRLADFDLALGLISLCGGLYVLYLAFESVRTGPVSVEVPEDPPKSLMKGVLINVLNPHPYLFWITVGTPFILKIRQDGLIAPLLFVLSFYALLLGSKVFLALVAGKSRAFLTGRGYIYVMRVLGGLLAVFAVFLLKDAFKFLGILSYSAFPFL